MREFVRTLRRVARAVGVGRLLYQSWTLIGIIRELFL